MKAEINRQLFKFSFGIYASIVALYFNDKILSLILIIPFVAISILIFIKANKDKQTLAIKRNLLYVIISFIVLEFAFENHTVIISLAFLIFSFSHFSSYLITEKFSTKKINLTGEVKSIIGIITFFISGFLLIFLFANFSLYGPSFSVGNIYLALSSLIIAIIITSVELFTGKDIENLTIPFFTALFLFLFLRNKNLVLLEQFSVAILLAISIATVAKFFKLLTGSGSAAIFLLATIIFGFGQWKWTVPIFAFFLLSSILSKIRKSKNIEVEKYFDKSSVRDYYQVFANGGLAGVLVIVNQFLKSELIYIVYVSSIAAVCADTWATEIGTFFSKRTYNILNFNPIEPGISGGVSFPGFIGAFLGAFMIGVSSINWVQFNFVYFVMVIVTSGIFGSLIDSILGASVQVRYLCPVCGIETEKYYHCSEKTIYKKGSRWFTNDIVNLSAALSGGILCLILLEII